MPIPRSRALWCARALLPLFLFPFLYKLSGRINIGLPRWVLDGPLESLEGRIFGGQPSMLLAERAPWVPLSEALHACYFGLYLLIPCPAVSLLIRGRDEEGAKAVFALCGCLLLLLLFYIWLPVTSPLYRYPMIGGPPAHGFFFRLAHRFSREGGVIGAAFPSGHAALATLALLLSWKWMRGLFWITLVPTFGLLIATVYCRYHYALDTLAGMAVGGAVFIALIGPAAKIGVKKWTPSGIY
jgi:membrane-associated phospholipid phosphatase